MKMNGTGMRIGVTVLALGVSLLTIPTSQAQRAAGISRVGWLEVCGPGPRRPHFDIFRGRLAELGYVEGKNLTHNPAIAAGASRRGDRVSTAICYTLVRSWHITSIPGLIERGAIEG